MNEPIKVDFDQKTGRFVISAPFWALGMMRSIPNRRFEKKLNNAWTAPALRANIQYLSQVLPSNTQFTQAARARISESGRVASVGLPFPSDYKFKTQPFEHQMMALHAAYGRNGFALFMDMRTGKTKVVVDLSMALHQEGRLERHVIIPLRTLRMNWGREYSIHADPNKFDIHYLESGGEKQFLAWEAKKTNKLKVLMVGIESLSAGKAIDYVLKFMCGPKCMATIDESDTIKNDRSARTTNSYKIRDKAEFRLIMTGTPISKGPMDFYSQFEFLDPNILGIGDFYSFKNRYAIMGGYENKEIIGYQNMEELVELVRPHMFQVRYSDVFSSPPKINQVRTVCLSDEQTRIYKQIKRSNIIQYNGDIKLVVQNVLEKVLRFQEVCGGFWSEKVVDDGAPMDAEKRLTKPKNRYLSHKIDGPNPKLDATIDILTNEYKGVQGIVWALRKSELALLVEELSKYGRVGLLSGEVEEADRNALDNDFRNGKIDWIVANPTTGGRGYTFDRAMVMVNYSFGHNFIHRQQSLERATSSKKKEPVIVIDLVAENTVDDMVLKSIDNKQDVSDYIRGRLSTKKGIDDMDL